jgi:hypothetical protein
VRPGTDKSAFWAHDGRASRDLMSSAWVEWVPIKRASALIGGLGVAGGLGPEDQKLCEDVLRELGYELDFEQFNRIR